MSGQWIYWLGWIAGLAFIVTMLALARWALFGDKPRGRLRCPKCWYDMSHSPPPGLTCSECGRTVRNKSQLTRTRRRWGLATLAILASTTLCLSVLVYTADRGWLSLLPTRALIAMIPLDSDGSGPLFVEIAMRNNRGDLSDAHLAIMIERFIAGDPWARPVSEDWIRKYGRLIEGWRGNAARVPGLAERLNDLPPAIELTPHPGPDEATSERLLSVRVRDWWPRAIDSRIVLSLDSDEAALMTVYRGPSQRDTALVVPIACDDGAIVNVRIEKREAESEGPWTIAGRQRFAMNIVNVQRNNDPLEKVSDPAIDALMRQVFDGRIVQWTGGPSPVRFRYLPWHTYEREFDDVAVGVEIELLREEVVARRLRMWWRGGGGRGVAMEDRDFGSELPQENLDLLMSLTPGDSRWTMRVRGVESLAARVPDARRHWAGQIVTPIRVESRQSPVHERSWWTEPPVPVESAD